MAITRKQDIIFVSNAENTRVNMTDVFQSQYRILSSSQAKPSQALNFFFLFMDDESFKFEKLLLKKIIITDTCMAA